MLLHAEGGQVPENAETDLGGEISAPQPQTIWIVDGEERRAGATYSTGRAVLSVLRSLSAFSA